MLVCRVWYSLCSYGQMRWRLTSNKIMEKKTEENLKKKRGTAQGPPSFVYMIAWSCMDTKGTVTVNYWSQCLYLTTCLKYQWMTPKTLKQFLGLKSGMFQLARWFIHLRVGVDPETILGTLGAQGHTLDRTTVHRRAPHTHSHLQAIYHSQST